MKQSNKRNAVTIGLALLVLSGLGAEAANAAVTVYPGNMCERLTGPFYKQNWGSIYNPSNSKTMRVTCPFASTSSVNEVNIEVTDQHGANNQNVACEAFVVTRNASTSAPFIIRTGRGQSVGFGSGTQDIGFQYANFSAGQSIPDYTDSSKFLICSIPPKTPAGKSYIHHYTITD